jgi:hypothetical protein
MGLTSRHGKGTTNISFLGAWQQKMPSSGAPIGPPIVSGLQKFGSNPLMQGASEMPEVGPTSCSPAAPPHGRCQLHFCRIQTDDACTMPVAASSSRAEQFRNSHRGTLSDFTAPVTGKSSVYRASFVSKLRFREQELSFDLGL